MSDTDSRGQSTDWLDNYTSQEREAMHREFDHEESYLAMAEVELATLREDWLAKAAVVNAHRARLSPDAFRVRFHLADEVEST